MTFVALVLLGAGIIYIASALADETLLQTMQDFLAGKQIDWSGAKGAETAGATWRPGSSDKSDAFAQGWPARASEGGPAGILGTAWNYCVETAGALLLQMSGGPTATPQEITQQVEDMVAHGWASGSQWLPPSWQPDYGKSRFDEEQNELSALGLQTNRVDLGGYNVQSLQSLILPAIQSGRPVGFGMNKAYNLYDLATQTYPNSHDRDRPTPGVRGHAITIEGYNSLGVYAADPNSAEPGAIDYYSWESLVASDPGDALVPQ